MNHPDEQLDPWSTGNYISDSLRNHCVPHCFNDALEPSPNAIWRENSSPELVTQVFDRAFVEIAGGMLPFGTINQKGLYRVLKLTGISVTEADEVST